MHEQGEEVNYEKSLEENEVHHEQVTAQGILIFNLENLHHEQVGQVPISFWLVRERGVFTLSTARCNAGGPLGFNCRRYCQCDDLVVPTL